MAFWWVELLWQAIVNISIDKKKVAKINSFLPEEMLRMIFSFLPPKDLKSAVLVCKLWSRVGQAPGLWSWVTFYAQNNEAMVEQMRLPRLQNVSLLKIMAPNVSEELMEEVAKHPGLKKVETEASGTNLSLVRPELVARALSKMEDLNLWGTRLTVDQLNCLFANLASGKNSTPKGKLDLLENDLYADGLDHLLLAAAITRFKIIGLDFVTQTVSQSTCNSDSVLIAIFDALGSSFSCVQHLELYSVNLSPVDAKVLAKAVSKMNQLHLRRCSITPRQATELFIAIGEDESKLTMLDLNSVDLSAADAEVLAREVPKIRWVLLQSCSLTARQATALFTSIGEDECKLRVLDLSANDLSSVQPSFFIRPLKFLKGLYLNGTNLTTNQVETILDGLENASNIITHLRLDDIDVSQVDSTKLVKVNHLRVVTLWQTQISEQQIIDILEASLTATKLDKIRWGHYDDGGMRCFAVPGTLEEWEKLQELLSIFKSRQNEEFYRAKFFREIPYHPCICFE